MTQLRDNMEYGHDPSTPLPFNFALDIIIVTRSICGWLVGWCVDVSFQLRDVVLVVLVY